MDDKTKKRAKKVVDAGMNIPLASLTETIETNEKLEALLSKEIVIPSIPEEIEITLEGVEYIKGEKGDASDYPSEISVINLPEVQKVEVLNFPEQKAPIVEMNNEEVVAELKNISEILSKEEVEGVDRTEIVDEEGKPVDFKKLFTDLSGKINTQVRGPMFPSQSQSDLTKLAADYATQIDDTTTASVTYIGKAAINSASSSAVWQVQKIDESTTPTTIKWAGSGQFDQIFNNRTSLTYN
jgi:hypothetical protein